MTDLLVGDAVVARLTALGAFLAPTAAVWAAAPFRGDPAWLEVHPEVAAWLEALTDDDVLALEADPKRLADGPGPLADWVGEGTRLAALGRHAAADLLAADDRRGLGMKARKWQQVRDLVGVLGPELTDGPVVEWCSGRGHLGRTLAAVGDVGAVLVEKDASLCAPPRGWPERPGVRHARHDVLDDAVFDAVPAEAQMVGLHACGRLTDRLLDAAERQDATSVTAVPCCPHRLFGPEAYVPRSVAGQAAGLVLHDDALRLAALDDVCVRPRRRDQRMREVVYRLAIDALAREAGIDREGLVSFASVPRPWMDLDLPAFVDAVVARHGLPMPATWDPDAVLGEAQARWGRIRRLALARLPFRRPLELWWVLDRAAWLVERGWDVRVGRFTERTVTPRDVAVVARRSSPPT